MNNKIRALFFICLGLLFGMSVMYIYNNFIANKKENISVDDPLQYQASKEHPDGSTLAVYSDNQSIDLLTEEKKVILYIKQNHRLPDYYITKSEAKKLGWNPSKGNLCDIVKGKAIGGDLFGNRERKLPQNNSYFEADVNYKCGKRNGDRVIFTKAGEVYLTKNHYQSFEKK